MRRLCAAALLLAAVLPAVLPAVDDARVRRLLKQRVEDEKKIRGLVAGVVDEQGARVITQGDGLNGDSVFEIGSITKVFTAILLAEMAERGEVALDDPVQKYLPENVTLPVRNAKPITLRSIAAQSSGLPRLPANLAPKDPRNPYADYTADMLYDAVRRVKIEHDPLEHYEYSNFAFGLLGHVLALRAGKPYEDLLRERVLAPLGLSDTAIALSEDQARRFVPGFTAMLAPTGPWDLPTLAGAGALRSTANDMNKFLRAQLGLSKVDGPLGRALEKAREPVRATGVPGLQIALAWHILTRPVGDPNATRLIWHNGGTGGYRSWLGLRPETKSGVVVLANTAFSVDDIARNMLDPGYRVEAFIPNARKRELMVEEERLQRFTGRYRVNANLELVITLEDGRLRAQAPGQAKVTLYAETPERFFVKEAEIQIAFGIGGLVLTQNSQSVEAEKVD